MAVLNRTIAWPQSSASSAPSLPIGRTRGFFRRIAALLFRPPLPRPTLIPAGHTSTLNAASLSQGHRQSRRQKAPDPRRHLSLRAYSLICVAGSSETDRDRLCRIQWQTGRLSRKRVSQSGRARQAAREGYPAHTPPHSRDLAHAVQRADLRGPRDFRMSPEVLQDTCGHHHPDHLRGAAAIIV